MRATLEFDLPEDQDDHAYAVSGLDALLLISNIEDEIRSMVNDNCGMFLRWRNGGGKECQGDYETLKRVWDLIIAEKQERRLPELR
jgi:hypothetical protein